MNKKYFLCALTIVGSFLANNSHATKYRLKLYNGALMPISPPVVFLGKDGVGGVKFGKLSTVGDQQICETGNPARKVNELKKMNGISDVFTASSPVLPGKSVSFDFYIQNSTYDRVSVEFMYGKSKDVCGTMLYLKLPNHESGLQRGHDQVFTSGRFNPPSIENSGLCEDSDNAVSCLREMSSKREGDLCGITTAFTGYLPGAINFIENKFGSSETQTLLIPNGGGVEYELSEIH